MTRHLLCLTVDTDPDGLSGKETNRETLRWEGLERLQRLPETLAAHPELGEIPVTWFVRGDGQLESILGSASHLLEKYDAFWTKLQTAGHEIAWHPHLYRQSKSSDPAIIITDPQEAQDELERLWSAIKVNLSATAFRNGEGWHTRETYATVERMGFRCDSSAIPGRRRTNGHPMNWEHAPNRPYYPALDNLCQAGTERALLELPMNTWLLQAPHDAEPRLRYMNPAVHSALFASALRSWENTCSAPSDDLGVWVMIFHPDEVLPSQGADALYSRSMHDLCLNLLSITESLQRIGHASEWVTVSRAAERWRSRQKRRIA